MVRGIIVKMNKFIISNKQFGYCLSDGELNGVDFSEIIKKHFKITHYEKWIDSQKCVKTKRTISYPKYTLRLYSCPTNFLNRYSWNQITVDNLKKYKFYGEYEFNGHKVYVGLHNVDSEYINELENKKTYTTYYDFGPLSIGGGIGHGSFDTTLIDAEYDNKIPLEGVPTDVLINELKNRNICYEQLK